MAEPARARDMISRFGLRVAIVVGMVLLAACAQRDGSSLRFGLSASPATLDPRYAIDAASSRMNRLIYRSLVDFDQRLEPVGSGAFALVTWPSEDRLLLKRLKYGQVVEFLHVADPTVRVSKLLRGELDLMQGDLPPELVADALIDQAESQPHGVKRAALYRQLQAQLLADLPHVPLWYEDVVLVTRADIVGYGLAADGNYDGLMSTTRSG